MKVLALVFIILVATIAWWWGISTWANYNPLAKYGVYYEKTCGEHVDFQKFWFFWNRDGKRIAGPIITGDDLYVKIKYIDGENIPRIVVRSEVYKSHIAILKLNFSDKTKPEFEVVKNKVMGIEYPPPWDNYYDRDPQTTGLRAIHKPDKSNE